MSQPTRIQHPTTTQPEFGTAGVNPAVDVVQSLQRGELPPSAEISQVLDKSEKSLDENLVNAPDEKSRALVRDTQAAIQASREFLDSKNAGDKIQHIFNEANLAAKSSYDFPDAVGLNENDRKIIREMRDRIQKAAVMGGDLLRSMVMDPQFRASLLDTLNLIYDIFYKVADQVAKDQPSVESEAPVSKRAKRAAASAKRAIKGKRTDQERKELSERLGKLLSHMRENEVYQKGINNLFKLADLVKVGAKKVGEKVDKMDVDIQTEPHTKNALQETKALAEEFLPEEQTLDPLIEKLKDFVLAVRKDKKLATHFRQWRDFIESSLKSPNKLTQDDFIKQGEKLAEDALDMDISDHLSEAAKSVYDEWKSVFENFKKDEELNVLNLTFKKLMSDITKNDEQGRTTLDLEGLSRFRPILVELLKKNLDKIPLPDVKGEDETYQYRAWNLVANGSEILPDCININTSTRSQAAIKDTSRPSWLQGDLLVSVQNIKTSFENVQFWFNRKTFPQGEDSGSMDIDIAGGITIIIKLVLEAADTNGGLMFTTGSVYCRADDVKVKVRDTKHDIFYNVFSGWWEDPIKENIEKFISSKLAEAIKEFRDAANTKMREFQKEGLAAAVPDVIKQQITA